VLNYSALNALSKCIVYMLPVVTVKISYKTYWNSTNYVGQKRESNDMNYELPSQLCPSSSSSAILQLKGGRLRNVLPLFSVLCRSCCHIDVQPVHSLITSLCNVFFDDPLFCILVCILQASSSSNNLSTLPNDVSIVFLRFTCCRSSCSTLMCKTL